MIDDQTSLYYFCKACERLPLTFRDGSFPIFNTGGFVTRGRGNFSRTEVGQRTPLRLLVSPA